jgi:hypothetical protein
MRRRVGTGTIQTVYLVRQRPFRPPMFSIGLSVVPAVLMEGWEAVAPRTLEIFNKARVHMGGLDYGIGLNHADGHLGPAWYAPRSTAEAEVVATEVIRQFERAGLPWLERHSDPAAVVEEAAERNEDVLGGRLLAAALIEVLPSNDPRVVGLVDSALFGMSYQWDRMTSGSALGLGPSTPDEYEAAQQELDLDNWLAERLIDKAGFMPDRSSWPQRSEALTRRLSQRRDEGRKRFERGLQAFGINDGYRDDAAARDKLSKMLGPKLSSHFEGRPPRDQRSD